jgi:exoribonuclease II
MEELKYPIGKFNKDSIQIPKKDRISVIATFPEKVEKLLNGIPEQAFHQTYREGAWNLLQLIHHCADSHMNGFIRFKLALTEKEPRILPYNQPAWAALADADSAPVESSLDLLRGLHNRWSILLNTMKEDDFQRTFIHPENPIGTFTLDLALALYSWHCEHHYAHMKLAISQPA